jgi:uracil-DNA glycosylase
MRQEQNLTVEVPNFDPNNGNEKAMFLFILEAPGPKAVKSGIISTDNPDPSARNFKAQLSEAGIEQSQIAIWNIVPWYIGNKERTKIRASKREDIEKGREYAKLISLNMPNLKAIVLVGGAARRSHVFFSQFSQVPVFACHHTSALSMNSRPLRYQENILVFRNILRLAGK